MLRAWDRLALSYTESERDGGRERMGNPKQKWTPEEEEALRAGVAKYGPGKWKCIQRDPEFNILLNLRSNIDLKDKWRNLSASAQAYRDKLKNPMADATPDAPATSPVDVQTTAPDLPDNDESPPNSVKDEPAKELPDGRTGPRYNELIFEALSAAQEPHGLDARSIFNYIQERVEVPKNFRKHLSSRLRRLVQQGKLEKVNNFFTIKNNPYSEQLNINVDEPRQPSSSAQTALGESLKEAAEAAAKLVAKSEVYSAEAEAAVMEAERVAKMAEETDAILQLAKEMFEKCSKGEKVPIE